MDDIIFDITENHKTKIAYLSDEFRNIPVYLFHYGEAKVRAQYALDLAKAQYERLVDEKYCQLKADTVVKHTDPQAKAASKLDPQVIVAQNEMFSIKKDVGILIAYLESLRAKKDMLIQLGADARKE